MSQAAHTPYHSKTALDGVWKARQIIPMHTLERILEGKSSNFEILFAYPERAPTHYQLHDKEHDVGIILSVRDGEQFAVVEATYNRHRLAYAEALDENEQFRIKKGFYDHGFQKTRKGGFE